ncbi:hypothetical protein [Brevibacillus laterosporus]|uniref:hypothetical protein n=1 Tax=Brevibacillus laterosporus TaxID=1465 RepID=UPI000CE352A0|nr:hypothetical protein [Brevibacillus laterosporus]NKQ18434.1 hypothetical protein [Brevibacillus laterosporus]PPA85947.1 hypothetical protein C4A76_14990 [Brevibacillus laterosporus]WNX33202.1 hypothetical protein RWW94_10580 [Brevibacillus laterosporus]
MKKSFLLVAALSLSLITGCSKPADTSETKLPQKQEESVAKVVEEKNDIEYAKFLEIQNLKANWETKYDNSKEPGFSYDIKNIGEKSVKSLEITFYFLDAEGKPVGEKTMNPFKTIGNKMEELKPNYTWKTSSGTYWSAENISDDWKEGSVEAKITKIQLTE